MAKNRKTPDMNLPVWFDGQNINEALFCEEFLHERRIIFANGAFFTPDGRVTDDLPLRGEIYDKLKFCAVNNIPRKITNILEVLKLEAQVPDFPPEQDRIHLSNGTLLLNGTFTKGRPAIVRNRLPVVYNPHAPTPVTWLKFLDGLLHAEDIPTLQEFFGYCLIPSNKGQRMMVIKGNGGEGKSQIGAVLSAIFGTNMKDGSIGKISENRFARADLEHILLCVDDDMRMEALRQTNYVKSIVTAQGKMDLERKGKQSYQEENFMMKKRIVSLGLAAMMTAGLFAGCGNSSESQGDSTASGSKSDDIVTLKWVTIGSGMPDNYDSWVKKVNDYVGEKIGVNIDMEVVAWGDWDNRRNIIISTNEDYDIIFGNGNVYTSDTKLGAYYDITDLIDDNMPGLKELMPSDYWDAVAIDGKIYAVPTYKDSSLSNYAIWDKEIVDKYNLDIESMTDISSLTDTFKQIKSDTNDYPVYVKNDGLYYIFDTYDQLGAGCQALGVKYNDKDAKVCYTLEQDDIYSELETIHEWYQDGIINPDASTLSEGRVYNVWRVAQGWSTAAQTSWGPQMGKDVEVAKIGDTILSNDTDRKSVV